MSDDHPLTDSFPTLETPRLILRPIAPSDLEFVFRHFSDPLVAQYLLDEAPLTTLEQAQDIIDFYTRPIADTYNRWIMVRKADQQPIGSCGFHKWNRRNLRSEIGYDLTPTAWQQGFMREALTAAIHFGFTNMGLNRIEALVYPANTRSLALLHKLGFQQEGLLRDYFYQSGQFYDHLILALLQRDWQQLSVGE